MAEARSHVMVSRRLQTRMSDVERQRLCQQRRRRGAIVVRDLVLSPGAIAGLIRLNWLAQADRGDREKVSAALFGLLKHALRTEAE